MKKLFLIRHGESESNAGGRTAAPHATLITDKGRAQAERLAETWSHGEPQLIVTSPFVRTKHTAEPFIKRHPNVRHDEWAIQEFTQLEPSNWAGTTHEERMPKVLEYWERADPLYCDGPGAESFVDFIGRIEHAFDLAAARLHVLGDLGDIVVFTHGHLIQAAIWTVLFAMNERPTRDSMQRFFRFAGVVPIDNTAVVPFTYHVTHWTVGAIQPAALP